MNDDTLVAVANQKDGANILLNMANNGHISLKGATDAVNRRNLGLEQKLAVFFIRSIAKIANL